MNQVWASSLPSSEKFVLLAIADMANHDGTNAWPGVNFIADRCSMSRRSVQRLIRSLEERGVLTVHLQKGGNDRTPADRRPNRYDVNLSALNGVPDCHAVADEADPEHERGVIHDTTGCHPRHHGVTSATSRGDSSDTLSVLDPSLNRQETNTESDDFDNFWRKYPRRTGKANAVKRWRTMKPADRDAALAALDAHIANWRATKTEPQFIPHPATWLNGRRWEDEITVPEEGALARAIRLGSEARARMANEERARMNSEIR